MYLAIDIIVRLLIFTCMWIIVNCLTLVAAEKPLKCVWLSQRKREELILSRFYRDILALHTCMNIPSIHVKIHGYETVLFVGFSLISMLLVELDDQRNIRISTVALCYLENFNSNYHNFPQRADMKISAKWRQFNSHAYVLIIRMCSCMSFKTVTPACVLLLVGLLSCSRNWNFCPI